MKSIVFKSLLALASVFIFTQTFSQNKVQTNSGVKKDSLLCKEWKLLGVEEFGVLNKPNSKQTNDLATFGTDHKARIIQDGVDRSGTWTADKYFSYVTLTVEGTGAKRAYKVLRINSDTLKLEYQDEVLVRTKYTYIVGK